MNTIYPEFEMGFWHPLGAHGGEMPHEILKRKLDEIQMNGWTLWSFQFRHTNSLWFKEIEKFKPHNVIVFCSEGKGAKYDKGEIREHKYYRPVDNNEYNNIPETIKVTLPSKAKRGTAFIVKNIIISNSVYDKMPVKWITKNEVWRTDRIPTRGVYLIQAGSGEHIRNYRAILELQHPYIAEIHVDAPKDYAIS